MKTNRRHIPVLVALLVLALPLGGCASHQWGDAGREFNRSFTEQWNASK